MSLYSCLKRSPPFIDLIRVRFSYALLQKALEFNPDFMLVGVTFYDSANSCLGSNPVGVITDDISTDRGTLGPVEFHFQIGPDWSIIKYVLLFSFLFFPCSCSVSALCPPQQKANALKGWFLSP